MKIDRLIGIIMILLQKERISAQLLAEKFEVSLRTIYRDIEVINQAGIPVYAVSGVGGGFEILPQYKIDSSVFSSDELSAILTGLKGLSGVSGKSGLIQKNELENAVAKIKSLMPSEKARSIEVAASKIHIDLQPWINSGVTIKNLEIIKQALNQNHLLQFEYVNHSGKITLRTAEPYQLILKSQHWYLQSYCLLKNSFRLFKLSRMNNLQLLQESFTPRPFTPPVLDSTQISSAAQVTTTVKLRIHNSLLERILDFCSFENITPQDSFHYIVDFPFIENEFNYNILLGFGTACECLEPPHVRHQLKARIQKMAELYKS